MPYTISERVLRNRIAKSLWILDDLAHRVKEKYNGGLGSSFVDMLYIGERSCLERLTRLKVRVDENKNHYVVIDGKTIIAKGV